MMSLRSNHNYNKTLSLVLLFTTGFLISLLNFSSMESSEWFCLPDYVKGGKQALD